MTILKSIVAVLVLANVGYFLWSTGVAKSPDAVVAAPGTLKLVSEGGVPAAADVPSTSMSEPEATAPDAADVKRCISVGPFRDVSEAARVAGTLRAAKYDPRQRVAEGEVWTGVWVYLPLPSEKSAADQIWGKLKAGGFDDALEMPGPNDSSVISLGLYSEARRAQTRVAQAQALSLNPTTADRKRNGNVYWIDIDLKPSDGMLNPSDLQGEAGHSVRLEVRNCPSLPGDAK